jgi:hypothetical protein
MRPVRFTIANIVLAVAFVAVAIAALKEPTDWWDCGLFSLTLASLLLSTLMAVHRTGQARAFWMGFSLFGMAYLVASLVPPVETRLITTKGLYYLEAKKQGRDMTQVKLFIRQSGDANLASNGYSVTFMNQPVAVRSTRPSAGATSLSLGTLVVGPGGTPEDFVRVGHSLIALLLAFVGGHVSRLLHASDSEAGTTGRPEPVS